MSQFERGGTDLGRWPADVANVADDRGALVDDLAEGGADDEASRVAGLPDHEIDQVDTTGGGMNALGGLTYSDAPDAGAAPPDDDALASGDRAETGLPLGRDAGDDTAGSNR